MKSAQKAKLLLGFRLTLAVVVMVAIVVQLAHGMLERHFSILNFFSYFTIQSNLFGVALLLLAAYDSAKRRKDPDQDMLRGAATFYLAVTAVIYALLLRDIDVNTSIGWVNTILHVVFPLAMLIDWLIDPPKRAITMRQSLLWLIYPVIYAVYTLVRGPFANDWYPYPFISPNEHSYGAVLVNLIVLGIGMAVLAVIVARLPRLSAILRQKLFAANKASGATSKK